MSKPRQQPQAKTLSLFDLVKMFPDEQSAINYLAKLLWKDGTIKGLPPPISTTRPSITRLDST